jgi:Ca2+-binding RTX toxin-like protein
MKLTQPFAALSIAVALSVSALVPAMFDPGAADAAARVMRCNGLDATIIAPAAGGVVEGTPGDDVIYGSGRADIIIGNGGNDTICGRGGNDVIYAGVARDEIDPVACARVREDDGAPVIFIDGGSGDDLICGPNATGGGFWEADGGSGNDLIGWASGVSELLMGGSGNDTMVGAAAGEAPEPLSSRVSGGSGDDTITMAPESEDDAAAAFLDIEADGGEGRDLISVEAGAIVAGDVSGGPGLDSCVIDLVDTPSNVSTDSTCEA